MICLKTRTFAVSQTTHAAYHLQTYLLWFAWKLVHLQYRKQLCSSTCLSNISCDLLENSYICSIANNHITNLSDAEIVVICLKTRTFAVSQTTFKTLINHFILLWFAWKLVHLQYRKQPPIFLGKFNLSCDLLENSYICSIANNSRLPVTASIGVVICLKTRTFAVSQTTREGSWKTSSCCDLLENSYICSIANNKTTSIILRITVVICLKTRTFAVSQTTECSKTRFRVTLWFAWKLVHLQYRKQP